MENVVTCAKLGGSMLGVRGGWATDSSGRIPGSWAGSPDLNPRGLRSGPSNGWTCKILRIPGCRTLLLDQLREHHAVMALVLSNILVCAISGCVMWLIGRGQGRGSPNTDTHHMKQCTQYQGSVKGTWTRLIRTPQNYPIQNQFKFADSNRKRNPTLRQRAKCHVKRVSSNKSRFSE